MEEGAETAEELCVDHLARSLPLKVGVVQSVVLVQPEEGNYDKKRKRRYLQPKYEPTGSAAELVKLGAMSSPCHKVVEIIESCTMPVCTIYISSKTILIFCLQL